MSGGSMNYLYERVRDAHFDHENTVLRRAFRAHLEKVADALKAIEWEDSCDGADEDSAIRACLAPGDALKAAVSMALEVKESLGTEITRALTCKAYEGPSNG